MVRLYWMIFWLISLSSASKMFNSIPAGSILKSFSFFIVSAEVAVSGLLVKTAVNQKVEPASTSLSSPMSPRMSITSRLAMDSPRPVPP